MVPAFVSVPGMFAAPKVGSSSFTKGMTPVAPAAAAKPAGVTMAVDAFQRKFQSYGRINVDYSRPKSVSQFKRAGSGARLVDYPQTATMAGFYPISYCGKSSGTRAVLNKFDEYCAKSMMKTFKRSAVPYGYYTTKCSEATTPYGDAEGKRVFSRMSAFRQGQKPIAIRLKERYEARKNAFVMSHGCHHEEKLFAGMPMSCTTFVSGTAEAKGACFRTVLPTSTEEDYMTSSVRAQLIQAKTNGVYPLGFCMDGHVKGQADDRRVAVRAAEYRAQQQAPLTVTSQSYAARQMATKLYGHGCDHEEGLFSAYPSVAAAMVRY